MSSVNASFASAPDNTNKRIVRYDQLYVLSTFSILL